ncbi:MAG: type II secretion system protein [Nitrosomonadales bacterium SCN 54-20]|nr:MAG: type II secretion system protein [Nitrosomonadales bacterium SCN 54-20]
MTPVQIAYLAVIFITVAGAAFGVMRALAPRPTKTRLDQVAAGNSAPQQKAGDGWERTMVSLAGPLAKLALPSEGWETSVLRTRFMHAGYHARSVPMVYFAAKAGLALVLPAIFLLYVGIGRLELSTDAVLFVLLSLAAFGYYLPNMVLARLVSQRKRELFESFPDAIDLMTVCVEAGLGLDAAMVRVAEEMRLRSKALAGELHLVSLELRAGRTREQALRNLAMRTGVEEIEALVSMLVQADRFGTSVAASLRVHSDTLRTTRRLRAEEAAAKIALKLLFPLIFFIFPSLLLVLMGPAFINIYRVLLPTLGGQ